MARTVDDALRHANRRPSWRRCRGWRATWIDGPTRSDETPTGSPRSLPTPNETPTGSPRLPPMSNRQALTAAAGREPDCLPPVSCSTRLRSARHTRVSVERLKHAHDDERCRSAVEHPPFRRSIDRKPWESACRALRPSWSDFPGVVVLPGSLTTFPPTRTRWRSPPTLPSVVHTRLCAAMPRMSDSNGTSSRRAIDAEASTC